MKSKRPRSLLIDTRPRLAGLLLGLLCYKPHLALLAPVALVAGGHWRTFAAAALGIGVRTAQKHLEHCYRTLGVSDRSQAARLAWEATDDHAGPEK